MNDKINQRKKLRKRIESFSNKQEASKEIITKLFGLKEYQQAQSIFVYLNSHKEVNTDDLIKNALDSAKRVFVPITRDIMYLSEVFADTEFIDGRFGIREPRYANLADIQPEITIVPLVGFDNEKNRLGQGRGYYDRYLRNYCGKKIGLAFSVQQVEKVITNDCDVKVDIIITEEKMF